MENFKGKMICGCQHKIACGLVREIRKQINKTDFIVIEDFYGKSVSVRLENDGGLWEISYGYSDL
jgi:hypothetical protein